MTLCSFRYPVTLLNNLRASHKQCVAAGHCCSPNGYVYILFQELPKTLLSVLQSLSPLF